MSGDRDWAEDAFRVLQASGHRSGRAREAVVAELARSGGGVLAKDLILRLSSQAGAATIYRSLSVLVELGLVRAVDVGPAQRFELVRSGGEHHHHAVCRLCGRTATFADDRLERAIDQLAPPPGFAIEEHDVILRGRCEHCRGGS